MKFKKGEEEVFYAYNYSYEHELDKLNSPRSHLNTLHSKTLNVCPFKWCEIGLKVCLVGACYTSKQPLALRFKILFPGQVTRGKTGLPSRHQTLQMYVISRELLL